MDSSLKSWCIVVFDMPVVETEAEIPAKADR